MEHEILGHTRKIFRVIRKPGLGFWHKLREVGVEIAIIVFAVSLAGYLERVREHNHEQHQVREFLKGLKSDLQSDIVEMKEDMGSFKATRAAARYFASIPYGQRAEPDSVAKHLVPLFSLSILVPNSGRYEGFKSSGKLGTIENEELQNAILDLYQEELPSLALSSQLVMEGKGKLSDYRKQRLKRKPDGTNNEAEVMATDEAINLCRSLFVAQEVLGRYDKVMASSQKIIEMIDAEEQHD